MPSGGMEQRQLHEFLTRLRLKWPYEFKVVDEALLVYWKPMTGIEKELMTAINVLRPGGERDASEYFTLEGHIQMWCDSAGWDFHIDMSQPDVWWPAADTEVPGPRHCVRVLQDAPTKGTWDQADQEDRGAESVADPADDRPTGPEQGVSDA